jgi:hypothetical protein
MAQAETALGQKFTETVISFGRQEDAIVKQFQVDDCKPFEF